MDKFSLLQNIENYPELRFKYMGSYPSDKVPQLTKYSFAIANSAASNIRGEHWIMIARMDKNTTLLILWLKRDQLAPFVKKKSTNGSSLKI